MWSRFAAMRPQAYANRSKAASTHPRCWRQPSNVMCVNELTQKQRERIVHLVREGLSFRSIERITGHRRETISRYARDADDGKRTITTASSRQKRSNACRRASSRNPRFIRQNDRGGRTAPRGVARRSRRPDFDRRPFRARTRVATDPASDRTLRQTRRVRPRVRLGDAAGA